MDDARLKALEKIKKLLAMANGKNANQNEAEVAAGQAAKLMARYNIEHADVIMAEVRRGGSDNIVEVVVEETQYVKEIPTYYNVLVAGVAGTLGCTAVYYRNWTCSDGQDRPAMAVRGFRDDIVVAVWLATYVLGQADRLATASWRREVLPDLQERGAAVHASRRRSYKHSYKFGMVSRVLDRIAEVYGREAAAAVADSPAAAGRDLVALAGQLTEAKRKAIAAVFGDPRKQKMAHASGRDQKAVVDGMLDADKVSINRVVEKTQLALPGA
jgi:hypothetical protein